MLKVLGWEAAAMNLLKYEKLFPGRYGFDRNSLFVKIFFLIICYYEDHKGTRIYPKFPWGSYFVPVP
jgi:hypothetical protein